MISLRWLVATAFGLSLIAGCGKHTDFLNYVKDQKPGAKFDHSFKIKELVGHGRADILWVIDNSGSMASYQSDVATNTDGFMKGFVAKATVDWRMALISTDTRGKPYLSLDAADVLNNKSVDPAAKFQQAVKRLGTSGDGIEKMFDPAVIALKANPSFLRPDALLIFIVVTDAHEQSRENSVTKFIDYLKSVKGGDLKKVTGYGILGPQDWGCPDTDLDAWNYKGSVYEAFFTAVKGQTFKLCDPNFAQNLTRVGADIGERVAQPQLPLPSRPSLSTLQVTYRGKTLPGGDRAGGGMWRYDFDANAVVFYSLDFAPGDQEEVRVLYQEDTGTAP